MNKRKRVNLNMRISEESKDIINRASEKIDVSTTNFVIETALKEAKKILKDK